MGLKLTVLPKQEFVGRIGEDDSRRVACVGSKRDGVKDGEDGLAKADHIIFCRRAKNGGVDHLSCVEQGDDI